MQTTVARASRPSRWYLLLVPIVLAGLALGVGGYSKFVGPTERAGTVVDGPSGQPIAAASVRADAQNAVTDANGRYRLPAVKREAALAVTAEGYFPTELPAGAAGEVRLQPRNVTGTVRNTLTGRPVAQATVTLGDRTTATDDEGRFSFVAVGAGQPITVKAPGYVGARAVGSDQGAFDLQLQPNTITGIVRDWDTRQPLAGAVVSDGSRHLVTAADGRFQMDDLELPAIMTVTARGYEPARINDLQQAEVALKPRAIKALYVSFFGIGDDGIRSGALDRIAKTESNALVVDVKGDRGWIAYESDIPLVKQIKAQQSVTIRDVGGLLDELKKKNVYTIARIVVFKDNPLAQARPDLAIRDRRTGKPWVDGEGLAWADPFQEEVWEYNVALAVEAARRGFDEIQFDYTRFPTDPSAGGSIDTAVYSKSNRTMAARVGAINGFLARAQSALAPYRVPIGVDVFGYTTWREDDMGIGQHIESMAPFIDVLCPMVYPSTYSDGLPLSTKYVPAPKYPYEIVYESVKRAADRLQRTRVKIRPWLQYFNDYSALELRYGAREIDVQRKASADAGGLGWMMWDPANAYGKGGLGSKQ
ncbi:MAG: carboxypeptidase regulatory-like domain-containing protein [Chloroflexi bacterium]|nr:carboxypeptidase regulatory-like domain-containing protein [Chloroflexota bacterium]